MLFPFTVYELRHFPCNREGILLQESELRRHAPLSLHAIAALQALDLWPVALFFLLLSIHFSALIRQSVSADHEEFTPIARIQSTVTATSRASTQLPTQSPTSTTHRNHPGEYTDSHLHQHAPANQHTHPGTRNDSHRPIRQHGAGVYPCRYIQHGRLKRPRRPQQPASTTGLPGCLLDRADAGDECDV